MIIAIDGYDGTGKTTLAKNLISKYGFIYLDKLVVKKCQYENKCSLQEAIEVIKNIEKKLFTNASNLQIAKFYCDALLWLKNFEKSYDIILDRGILTTYAVCGDSETEELFKYYVKNGAFFDASIYLIANDEERRRRIYKRNPNDPDLKYPTKWRDNNLEEFASGLNLNYYKIDTNNKTPEDVLQEAIIFLDKEIASKQNPDSKVKMLKFEGRF